VSIENNYFSGPASVPPRRILTAMPIKLTFSIFKALFVVVAVAQRGRIGQQEVDSKRSLSSYFSPD